MNNHKLLNFQEINFLLAYLSLYFLMKISLKIIQNFYKYLQQYDELLEL